MEEIYYNYGKEKILKIKRKIKPKETKPILFDPDIKSYLVWCHSTLMKIYVSLSLDADLFECKESELCKPYNKYNI